MFRKTNSAVALLGIALAASGLTYGRQALAQSGPLTFHVVELDIVPSAFDEFMAAAKEDAAATIKEPGCRQFNIAVSQSDPHHVLFVEVYADNAALKAHQATDWFKKFVTTTKEMVAKASRTDFSSAVVYHQGGE
jgi:quinol monooxygenase YgiN